MSNEAVAAILADYHRFDDGLLESFNYRFWRDGSMAVELEFYARNHRLDGNVWKTVRLMVNGVREVRANFAGGESNVIGSGVKLLSFAGKVCLDVDGEYGQHDPVSMDEVRRCSPCFVTGESIEAVELD